MEMYELSFRIAAGCAACALIACGGGDHGGLRRAPDAAAVRTEDASESDAAVAEVQRWVGQVEDTDIRIGAVVDRGERARIFFCGGPSSYETATRWITVEVGEDGAYTYEENGWRVTGRVEREVIRGELTRDGGDSSSFSVEPIAPGTLAGLYEGQSDCGRLGLIVTHPRPSDDPSAQGACVGAGHPPEQVNPILPIALVGDEIGVKIGETEASVREAAPPPR